MQLNSIFFKIALLFSLSSFSTAFFLPSLPNVKLVSNSGSFLLSPKSFPQFDSISNNKKVVLSAFPERDSDQKLTRENEPDEYFKTNLDKKPIKERLGDPLVLIGIGSIFLPFILVGLLFSSGYLTR